MAAHQVTRVWSVIVTALLAFFASLGLIGSAAAAPVTQQEQAGNRTAVAGKPSARAEAAAPLVRPYESSRPPTMKQRIRAEAHGSSPSARGLNSPATPLSDLHRVDETKQTDALPEQTRPDGSEELSTL